MRRADAGTMMSPLPPRVFNFSAGPAALPEEVLLEARENLWSIDATGIGILEHSHRGPVFDRILHETEAGCRRLADIPNEYAVLFMAGGMTMQFTLAPMNFLTGDETVDVLHTDVWTEKAVTEAKRFGKVHLAYDGSATNFDHVPAAHEITPSGRARYAWCCSNNTIYGTQYAAPPVMETPLFTDASSDIFSRPLDVRAHAAIMASAQKNLGPAGLSLVIIRRDWLERTNADLPGMLDYRAHARAGSRLNTPPTFGVYMLGLLVKWLSAQGGLRAIAERNQRKAALVYAALDRRAGFYRPHARVESRSLMNIVFRTPNAALDAAFAEKARAEGLDGLRGHRALGGLRASIYNAMPPAGCEALASFIDEFARTHG